MDLRTEKAYPFCAALVVSGALWFEHTTITGGCAKELAGCLVSILSITVGFMATALTILLTAADLPRIARLKTSRTFLLLVNYHWAAITLGFGAAVLCLVVIVSSPVNGDHLNRVLFCVWIGLVAWAFVGFLRVVYLMKKLLVPEHRDAPATTTAPQPSQL